MKSRRVPHLGSHPDTKLNKWKKSLILCGIVSAFVFAGGMITVCNRGKDVDPQGCEFTESARQLRNPGRGYYNIYLFEITDEEVNYSQLVEDAYQKDKATSLTLVEINLQEYREGEISQAGLKNIDALLYALKKTDKQLIVRFLYDWAGENEKYEPDRLDVIGTHMAQLKKIINNHSDHIFVLQGFFVGNWGEMNGTRYSSNEDLRQLAQWQSEGLAPSIYLSVRMPSQWRGITRIKEPDRDNLAKDPLAIRLGLYNDGMLGNETDYGTYGSKETGGEGRLRREDELTFQNELCRYVPNGGEVINDNSYNDFQNAIRDLGIMHVTYLNEGHDEAVLEKWKNTKVTGGGCFHGMDGYTYIERHLGYRLLITGTEFYHSTFAGRFAVSVKLKNVGFAPLYEEMQAKLVFYNKEDKEHPTYVMRGDLRELTGGSDSEKELVLRADISLDELQRSGYILYFYIVNPKNGEHILLANEQDEEEYGKDECGYRVGTVSIY